MIPIAVQDHTFTRIDVSAIAEANRFSFWSEVICKNFSPSENETDRPVEQFQATLVGRKLGSVGLCNLSSTPMRSSRTQQSLRTDPLDCFFVSLLTEGKARLTQNGRRTEQTAGQFLMYDSAQTFTYNMLTPYSGMWIRIPRQALSTRMVNPEAATARTISATSTIGRLCRLTLEEISRVRLSGADPASPRLASSMLDLLVAAFESELKIEEDRNPHHINMLDRAKTFILANMEDTDLDTDALVDALGVSRRTLNRLFAKEGTTPIRWLWQQRLARGREMLESGKERRVTDVALNCGFSDFSHFSRAFKNEFGISPKDLLARVS